VEREVLQRGAGGRGSVGDQGSLIFCAEISVDLRHRTARNFLCGGSFGQFTK